jgi:ribA/ribD-fused uncharacterized protein
MVFRMITRFSGDNAFLSNFFPCIVLFEGLIFPSSEHAFQAQKADHNFDKLRFTSPELTPGQAKRLGKKVTLRSDWDKVKLGVMANVVLAKFDQHLELRELLMLTWPHNLIEGNNWGDRFWGAELVDGEWVGENHLGKILMRARKAFGIMEGGRIV